MTRYTIWGKAQGKSFVSNFDSDSRTFDAVISEVSELYRKDSEGSGGKKYDSLSVVNNEGIEIDITEVLNKVTKGVVIE